MKLLQWPAALAGICLSSADAAAPIEFHAALKTEAVVVSEAVASIRNAEAALKSAGNTAEAAEMGSAAAELESPVAPSGGGVVINSDAKERQEEIAILQARLDRLEAQYAKKVAAMEARTDISDAEQKNKLESVKAARTAIEAAEEKLKQDFPDSGAAAGPPKIEIDSTVVPYPGAIEQFGREDTAKALTDGSLQESDAMVDSIESAQAVEGKRAVYRALTHLRGATITSYDGIARSHMKNVENYAAGHHWRSEHPVRHLAEEEADVDRWAFPTPAKKAAIYSPVAPPANDTNTTM